MQADAGPLLPVLPDLLYIARTRDPDDDHVLAYALVAGADLIVTADANLLTLKSYQDIPIVTAAEGCFERKLDHKDSANDQAGIVGTNQETSSRQQSSSRSILNRKLLPEASPFEIATLTKK